MTRCYSVTEKVELLLGEVPEGVVRSILSCVDKKVGCRKFEGSRMLILHFRRGTRKSVSFYPIFLPDLVERNFGMCEVMII